MKILFHISSLFGGGAERVMSYLINHSGGPKEICNNACGLLSPVGDVESFANNLYKVSHSEQLREQLVKKCIERRAAFSNDSILKKWDAFLIKCVDAKWREK